MAFLSVAIGKFESGGEWVGKAESWRFISLIISYKWLPCLLLKEEKGLILEKVNQSDSNWISPDISEVARVVLQNLSPLYASFEN